MNNLSGKMSKLITIRSGHDTFSYIESFLACIGCIGFVWAFCGVCCETFVKLRELRQSTEWLPLFFFSATQDSRSVALPLLRLNDSHIPELSTNFCFKLVYINHESLYGFSHLHSSLVQIF